jgi:hypothetical protein
MDFRDAQTQAEYSTLRRRYLTKAGSGVSAPVAGGATSLSVTFLRQEPNVVYGVSCTPSWDTTVWVTGKSVSGFTIQFGTAPAGAETVDWMTFRSED